MSHVDDKGSFEHNGESSEHYLAALGTQIKSRVWKHGVFDQILPLIIPALVFCGEWRPAIAEGLHARFLNLDLLYLSSPL